MVWCVQESVDVMTGNVRDGLVPAIRLVRILARVSVTSRLPFPEGHSTENEARSKCHSRFLN